MQQPGYVGDPYELVPGNAQYPGTSGVAVAWDAMRYFYGTVMNQAWQDMANVQGTGVILV